MADKKMAANRNFTDEVSLVYDDVKTRSVRILGKDNGKTLVYACISYPHIEKQTKAAEYFNGYFDLLVKNCKDYAQKDLIKIALEKYEKSENPRKRFCPRIYNYILECAFDRGKFNNIVNIKINAKLYQVADNTIITEKISMVSWDLSKMRIVKKQKDR